MLAIALALGSSLCYGVSNFLGPQLAKTHSIHLVLLVSQSAALAGSAVLLLGSGEPLPPIEAIGVATIAGAGNAGGLIGFYKAAELAPLSLVTPIGALGALVPVVYGLTSGDTLSTAQAAGLVLALGGAALAARRVVPAQDDPHPRAATGLLWACGSAVAFGVFLTALPAAGEDGRFWALFDARLAMAVFVGWWALRRLGAPGLRPSRDTATLTLPGLLLLAGTLLYVVATEQGLLSLTAVLGSLFPVVTVGLGVWLLGERLSKAQAAGVCGALLGIVLIAL